MKKTPAMDAWRGAVPRGICPGCKKPTPPNRLTGELLLVCRKRRCWLQYYAAYRKDHRRPNVRQKVLRRRKVRGEDVLNLTLECGHELVVEGRAAREKRPVRECRICKARRAATVARASARKG